MKTKLFLAVLIVIALAVPFVGITSSASAAASCDPAYVLQTGNTFLAEPTGVDDTANLQCAFDEAAALPPMKPAGRGAWGWSICRNAPGCKAGNWALKAVPAMGHA